MILTKFLNCLPIGIVGSTLLLTPNLTRRGLLFGVPVSPDFALSDEAHNATSIFRRNVALAFLVALLIAWQTPQSALGGAIPFVLLVAASGLSFYQAYRRVLPFRALATNERSVDLAAASDQTPRALWLAAGPFLLLAGTALFLHMHWRAIPPQFPVHWASDGSPDGWSTKSIKGVYGPILFAAEVSALMVLCACVSWFGARRSTVRSGAVPIFVAIEYLLAIVIGVLLPLQALFAIPAWVTVVLAIAPAPLFIAYFIKKARTPSGPPEQTPAECWKAGLFYYNPADPAVMVEKRYGFGYTLNFASPWSWVLMLLLLLVAASAPLTMS